MIFICDKNVKNKEKSSRDFFTKSFYSMSSIVSNELMTYIDDRYSRSCDNWWKYNFLNMW
jgi:hypothetical protein